MTDIPYIDRLRGDLVSAVGRRRRRIERRRRAALVGAPIALAAAVAVATVPGATQPALAIEQSGDWIELRIADVAATEAQMERETAPTPAASWRPSRRLDSRRPRRRSADRHAG